MSAPGEELRRALELERGLRERACDRLEELPFGRTIVTERLARVFEMNIVRVTAGAPGPDAGTVEREADRVFGELGMRHRKLVVDDPEVGASLRPGLTARGWTARPITVMALDGTPGAAPSNDILREIDDEENLAVLRAYLSTQPRATPQIVDQLTEQDRALGRAAERCWRFGAFVEGTLGAVSSLYAHQGVAQIRSIVALEAARGKGLGRPLFNLPAQVSAAAGHDITFTTADSGSWQQAFYGRLGYRELGTVWDFIRLPPLD